jgi:mannose-6-phosphate isomerase class I
MEYLKKKQSQIFINGNIVAREYITKNKNINIALVEIKGRHPKENWIVNKEVTELTFITKGSAILNTETERVSLKEGDVAILKPNEKYFWEGNCTLLTPCTPAWTPRQNKIVK